MIENLSVGSVQWTNTTLAAKTYYDVLGKGLNFDFEIVGKIVSVPMFLLSVVMGVFLVILGGVMVIKALGGAIYGMTEWNWLRWAQHKKGQTKLYLIGFVLIVVLTSGGILTFQKATAAVEKTIVDPTEDLLDESGSNSSTTNDDSQTD